MYEIQKTLEFEQWLDKLKDRKAATRVMVRLDRVKLGNFGDWKSVGDGVSELRIDYGPGYRVYFTKKDNVIVVLLIGGDKSSQDKDIEKAKQLILNYTLRSL